MKFLVLFSVFALCALNVNGFLHSHLKKGSSSASADASASGSASVSSSSSGHGGLAGIGNLLAIPLNIKKQLLLSHQKKFNKKIDHIIGHLNKFSSNFAASSSASAGASSSSSAGSESAIGLSVSGNGGASYDQSEYSSASATGSFDAGYQQNYQPAVHSYHPQPAVETQYHETPVTVELYQVQQPQQQQRVETAPAQTYGPPSYQPPAPIVEQAPTRDYLPPHTHRAGCTH